eukprot:GHVT01007467.1.p1 GENE.GHVT01007467.1~~GHVT01007467.1.p1  ORF type:complete len:223 (-),score=79.69 GHVT01007467.1:581-1249(-)
MGPYVLEVFHPRLAFAPLFINVSSPSAPPASSPSSFSTISAHVYVPDAIGWLGIPPSTLPEVSKAAPVPLPSPPSPTSSLFASSTPYSYSGLGIDSRAPPSYSSSPSSSSSSSSSYSSFAFALGAASASGLESVNCSPLQISPIGLFIFFPSSDYSGVFSLFKSPMVLMGAVCMGALFLLPKLQAMADPETLQEIQALHSQNYHSPFIAALRNKPNQQPIAN